MEIRPLSVSHAEAMAAWRYPGRYSTYDVGEIMTPERGVWAVEEAGELVGFCCFGAEARVPGAEEELGTLDVGYGMRPDLMGQGSGQAFVGAILGFAVNEFGSQQLRLLILQWNERSRKVAEALGFEEAGVVQSDEGAFWIMTRPTDG